MPKSLSYTKNQTCEDARQKPRNVKVKDTNLLNKLNESGSDDQDADATNANLINAIRYNFEKKSKNPAGYSAQFQSRKNALYANARKATQEFVRSSTNAFDGAQAMLLEMRRQEVSFEKYRDDFHVVIASNKVSLETLFALYPLVWKTLGQRRSDQLEAASTMLVNNAPRRHEILKEISTKARQQLEQARQQEKDAEDAVKLIEHFKQLLRG